MKQGLMIILLVLLLPLGSSSIFIEPLKDVYNYGDQLIAQTKLVPSTATSSQYTVDLKCGSNVSLNIYNNFFDLQANTENPVTITTRLLNPALVNITAPCSLMARFGNEAASSNSFSLSDEIIVSSELDIKNVDPGRAISISGVATEESGVPVNGFVEIFVPSLRLYKSTSVANGVFNATLMIPSDSKSGDHNLTVEVHNTDLNSRKINFGSSYDSFKVGQILKEIQIVTSEENAQPEKDFNFRIDASDQAGDPITREVSLIINKPKGIPFIKKVIRSGETQTLKFYLNDTPGYWSIETSVDEFSKRKLFYLSEVERLQTSLINDTLIITNIGNAPYSGPIEITIGSFVEIKQVKLNAGETQKFTLRAPDGDYSISIMESGESRDLGNAFLTGNAVKVTDFREDFIGTVTNPVIWWLAAILFVLIIVLVQIKVRMQHKPAGAVPVASSKMEFKMPVKTDLDKKTFDFTKKEDLGKTNPIPAKVNNKFDLSNFNSTPKSNFPTTVPNKVAPSALFGGHNEGIRERAVAIALYLNNESENTAPILNRALLISQEAGAKVYVDGEYKIILFSPRLTHKQDNESDAISISRRIQALFLEHMKMHKDNFNFGIGVNDGEIISEIEGSKFHFTSTGNLISFAKRIAYYSNTKLFVSDSVRRKVITTVRTEKSAYQGIWEVVHITDHSPSREFIKKFSERNKK